MSFISDEPEPSKLPQSSRFLNQSTLPDLRTFQIIKNNRPVAFNGQHSNISYNPFSFPQSKTKANFPLDFFHLPNKIHLTDLPHSGNPEPENIPSYKLDDNQAKDPIRFFDSTADVSQTYGAIKVKIPVVQDNLLRSNFQINSDLFWFQSNKLLNNSPRDEIKNRLQFHTQLIKFHTNQDKEINGNVTQPQAQTAKQDAAETIQPQSNQSTNPPNPNITATVQIVSPRNFSSINNLLNSPALTAQDAVDISTASSEILQTPDVPQENAIPLDGPVPTPLNVEPQQYSSSIPIQTPQDGTLPKAESDVQVKEEIQPELVEPSTQSNERTSTSATPLDSFSSGVVSTAATQIEIAESALNSQAASQKSIAVSPTGSIKQEQSPKIPKSENPKKANKKNSVPSFLLKLPMIDKRPIDLYKLFRSVVIRGGFVEVINKKLWAQIGRELGYKGKIMTSLSSSLKSSYQRILYPFELHLGQKKFELLGIEAGDIKKEPETVVPENELDNKGPSNDSGNIINGFQSQSFNGSLGNSNGNSSNGLSSQSFTEGFNSNEIINENGKRAIKLEDHSVKNPRLSPPLITGSAGDFSRSVKVKGSKGIVINAPHLIDIKPPISFAVKDEDTSKKGKKSCEIIESPILPQNQLNHALSTMITSSQSNIYQDESGLKSLPKIASIYSMRQFMEKDLKFQEFIVQHNANQFNKMTSNFPSFFHFNEPNMPIPERNFIRFDKYEELYWKFISNETSHPLLDDGLELEHGENLLSLVHGSGFVRIGDDIMNYKNNLNNLNINASSNKIINTANNKIISTFTTPNGTTIHPPNAPINIALASAAASNPPSSPTTATNSQANDVDSFNTDYYISNILQSAMNPWNLHNLPVLPNSLFGALSENDVNNQDLTNSRINIGMTFSTQNWKCEDHFTQLINYQFFGACKKWYFIPESEFEKFEKLILEVNENNKDRISINNESWKIEELMRSMEIEEGDLIEGGNNTDGSTTTLEYDTLLNSLENMINPFPEERLPHSNPLFQKLIDSKSSGFRLNQDFLITPDLLRERGIKFTTTIQRPGEFIIKSPKTYSMTLSFGLNFSEEVNFATQNWLSYALEGEKWLSKQNILPNFSTFKLLINLIQLYDSGKSIGFNSQIYSKVGAFYEELFEKEIELRARVRKLKIKEVLVDNPDSVEIISDDDFMSTFPSKVVLTDNHSKSSFILSLESFLNHHSAKTIQFETLQVELHVFHSDEKLKTFSKILSGYSIDYEQWTKRYEELMIDNLDLTLKVYKNLLSDGERIYSAISSANFLIGGSSEEDKKKVNELGKFKNYIENLRLFINDSNQFIEDCQDLLSIKHQQRIRSGNDYQRTNGLEDLARLIERIPTLNFSCIEIDQILEFKGEIENFDKASRSLLARKTRSLKEFDDLIDLGESFGIELPSLKFLTRIRDRLKWLEVFRLIEKGDDPYSDKKEVFSLNNLREFFEEALKILSEEDIPKIQVLETILNQSEEFNRDIGEFLKYDSADEVDLEKLRVFVERFQGEKLFLSAENYNELSIIHLNSKLVKELKEFKNVITNFDSADPNQMKFTYADVRLLQTSLTESGLKFVLSELTTELFMAESWVFRAWDIIRDKKIVTTLKHEVDTKKLNPKLTLNGRLIEKIFQYLQKSEFNFSSEDVHEISSSYLFKFHESEATQHEADTSKEEVEIEATPKYYCICREYEFGTMIECDKCNEWYHIVCVNEDEDQGEDDNYMCPVCKLIDSGRETDDFLEYQVPYEDFRLRLEEGNDLKVYPANELAAITEIEEKLRIMKQHMREKIDVAKSLGKSTEFRIDTYKFLLRKLYGSSVQFKDLVSEVVHLIRNEEKLLIKPKPIEVKEIQVQHQLSTEHQHASKSLPSQQPTDPPAVPVSLAIPTNTTNGTDDVVSVGESTQEAASASSFVENVSSYSTSNLPTSIPTSSDYPNSIESTILPQISQAEGIEDQPVNISQSILPTGVDREKSDPLEISKTEPTKPLHTPPHFENGTNI